MYRKIVNLRGEETLVIEWQESWRDLVIKMDNKVLGSVDTKEELKAGRKFNLPNGKPFTLVLSEYGLEVWYEGVEKVSGTQSGTKDFFGSSFRAMMSVGTINMVLSVFLMFAAETRLHRSYGSVLFSLGIALLVLGILTRKQNTKSGFILGFVFGAGSLVLSFLLTSYFGMSAAVYLIATLIKGYKSKVYLPTRKITIDEAGPLDGAL